jgi:hypothetical protein
VTRLPAGPAMTPGANTVTAALASALATTGRQLLTAAETFASGQLPPAVNDARLLLLAGTILAHLSDVDRELVRLTAFVQPRSAS